MCGIAGQINFGTGEPVDRDLIQRMAAAIAHRGPDDTGFFIDGPLGLGFRRLSIIDLAGGHQPMCDTAQSVWVVFNGEIYNYRELRTDLEQRGHVFRTQSDTEVLVHGYKEWQQDLFGRLNGMFGVAIWDANRKKLVVARDAMGIKLVYYRLDGGTLSFGSEIKPLLETARGRPDVDPYAVSLFLRFRYTPSPLTIYRGIRKLAPGTMLIVENGTCRESRWYTFTPEPFPDKLRDEDAAAELLHLYRGAMKRHLLSDVPVGLLLSGGLDSGLLLALMNENGSNWPTYTVGYGATFADDELSDAAETARVLKSKHTSIQLERSEFERSLPRIVAAVEEPITSSSIVPMYFVCEQARRDVKVALIGQGPDELFGGYTRHLGVHYGSMWRRIPSSGRALVSAGIARLPRNETLKRGSFALGQTDAMRRYQDVFSLAPETTIRSLFFDGALERHPANTVLDSWQELEPEMKHLGELGSFQHLEIRSSLPDELLMFGDKLSMVHGLEARVPYLDRTVVEYSQRLPASLKIRYGRRKWLHRQVCRHYLPSNVINRKKRGFAVNIVDGWFDTSLRGVLTDILHDAHSYVYRFIDKKASLKLLQQHQSGHHDRHKLLFSIVMLELCLQSMFASDRSHS